MGRFQGHLNIDHVDMNKYNTDVILMHVYVTGTFSSTIGPKCTLLESPD